MLLFIIWVRGGVQIGSAFDFVGTPYFFHFGFGSGFLFYLFDLLVVVQILGRGEDTMW